MKKMKTLLLILSLTILAAIGCSSATEEDVAQQDQAVSSLCTIHQRAVITSATQRDGGTCGIWKSGNTGNSPGWIKFDAYTPYLDVRGGECFWTSMDVCNDTGGTAFQFLQGTLHCWRFVPYGSFDLDVILSTPTYGTIHRRGFNGCDSMYDVNISVVPY